MEKLRPDIVMPSKEVDKEKVKEDLHFAVPKGNVWKSKVFMTSYAAHDDFISALYSNDNNENFFCFWYVPYLTSQLERGRNLDFSTLMQPQTSIYNQRIRTSESSSRFQQFQMLSTRNYESEPMSDFHVTILVLTNSCCIFQYTLTFSSDFHLLNKVENEVNLPSISSAQCLRVNVFSSILNYFLVVEDENQLIIRDYLFEYINDFNVALESIDTTGSKDSKQLLKEVQLITTYQIFPEENVIILICDGGKILVVFLVLFFPFNLRFVC
jgi:hypothetical protein